MPIVTGGYVPYPEFRKNYSQERMSPVIWRWHVLYSQMHQVEHNEYGSLTLSIPGGRQDFMRSRDFSARLRSMEIVAAAVG